MSTDHPPSGWDSLNAPLIKQTGFREYDCRWRFPEDINLRGFVRVGMALGTQAQNLNQGCEIIVGNDFRSYSLTIKHAFVIGLIASGMKVVDIGTVISPMAYYARTRLSISCVGMVTASHNPNGWTGIKTGFAPPFTHSPEEMAQLKKIILENKEEEREGGQYTTYDGIAADYLAHLSEGNKLSRKLKVVCATGNGTASQFAPKFLQNIGAEVIHLHTDPDWTFPNYNPNPESLLMLNDMKRMVKESQADLAIGIDGDGDRLGIVDDECEEIFSDKLGLIYARQLAKKCPNSKFIVDVKSTGAFERDSVLKEFGATVEYWKTGHSYMRRKTHEAEAILGIEKSGHFYFSPPVGDGFDCGLQATLQILKILDQFPSLKLSDLKKELPKTWLSPTMSPYCGDEVKYPIITKLTDKFFHMFRKKEQILGQNIDHVLTINGIRLVLEDGSWFLLRASSNTPNLVVVCESTQSQHHLHNLFDFIRTHLNQEPEIGDFDQAI